MPPIIPFPMPGAEAPVADEPPADAPSGEAAAASTPGVGEAGAAPLERDLGDDEFGAGEVRLLEKQAVCAQSANVPFCRALLPPIDCRDRGGAGSRATTNTAMKMGAACSGPSLIFLAMGMTE